MQKPHIVLTALFTIFTTVTLNTTTLDDAWTGDVRDASASIDGEGTFTYSHLTSYDNSLTQGPLSFLSEDESVSWACALERHPVRKFSSWCWNHNGFISQYNATAQLWSAENSLIRWGCNEVQNLECKNTGEIWTFSLLNVDDSYIIEWHTQFTSGDEDTFVYFTWEYDPETAVWSNTHQNLDYTFDASTQTWTRVDTDETWQIDTRLQTVTYTGPDATANRWVKTDHHTWVEEQSLTEWRFETTSSGGGGQQGGGQQGGGGGGNTHGKWININTGDEWTFDTIDNVWKLGDVESAFFPRHCPPMIVVQANEILRTGKSLYDTFISTQYPDGDINATSTTFLSSESSDIIMAVSPSGALFNSVEYGNSTSGYGADFGFSGDTNVVWESSIGEKWSTLLGWPGGTTLVNQSADIGVDGEQISGNPSIDSWWRNDAAEWVWQFSLNDNAWRSSLLDCAIMFQPSSSRWLLVDDTETLRMSWRYEPDDTYHWVWHDLLNDIRWKFLYDLTGGHWYCIEEDSSWYILDGGRYRDEADNIWVYVPSEYQWFIDGDTETTGKSIFPQLPCNYLGFAYSMLQNGVLAEGIESPRRPGSKTNLIDDITEYAVQATAYKEALDGIDGSFYGHDLYVATADATTPDKEQLCYDIENWKQEYDLFYRPFNADYTFYPTTGETFDYWAPSQWTFSDNAQGGFFITIANYLNGALIALDATTGKTTGTDFLIKIERDDTYNYTFTVYENETLLTTTTKSILGSRGPDDVDDGSVTLWMTYDNGIITIGRDVPGERLLMPLAKHVLFEYEFENAELATAVRYFSVSNLPEQTPQFTITSYPWAYFVASINAVESFNRAQDLMVIGRAEDFFSHVKENLLAFADRASLSDIERSELAATIYNMCTDGDGSIGYLPYALIDAMDGISTNFYTDTFTIFSYEMRNRCADIKSSFGLTKSTMFNYQYYIGVDEHLPYTSTSILDLENIFTSLLATDVTTLSSSEREELLATAQADMERFISASETNIGNLLFVVRDLPTLYHNDDLEDFVNYYVEEIQLLQNLGIVLSTVEKAFLERFIQQDGIYGDASRNQIIAQELQRNLSRSSAIGDLAARLSSGETSLYAAALSLSIVLAIFNTFDEARRRTDAYLANNGYSNYHTTPDEGDPLRTLATAQATLQSVMNDLEKELKISGNTFSNLSTGLNSSPENQIEDLLMHAEKSNVDTTTVDGQLSSVDSGSDTLPSHMGITTSDNATTPTVVREITTTTADKTSAFTRVYVKDAIMALGNANLSSSSGSSLSVLGNVQLSPEGNTTVLLNSDIYITGDAAFKPTRRFGSTTGVPRRCIPARRSTLVGHHEIRFYSDVERNIIVATGTELDLTCFAKGSEGQGQRIVFAGKTRLVIEPGAKVRLPYTSPADADYRLTLAFTDDAEFIFKNIENYDIPRWESAIGGTDNIRSKLLGVGLLEFSGNARASIMRAAQASIEADYTTNRTNISVLLKDNARWCIGDENIAGGVLQIGNIITGGYNNRDTESDNYPNNSENPLFLDLESPFEPRATTVEFSLTINGSGAEFFMGREAFLGLGVGVVNKSDNPNGTAADNSVDLEADPDGQHYQAWELQPLQDVTNIHLTILNGRFSHHSVGNGSSANASVMAIGPHKTRGAYKLYLSKAHKDAIWGGGNVVLWRSDEGSGVTEATAQPLSIWNTVSSLSGLTSDTGTYSILAPAPIVYGRQVTDSADSSITKYGRAAVKSDTTFYQFTGPQDEFFLAMTMQSPALDGKVVVAYNDNGNQNNVAFVDNTSTIRSYLIYPKDVVDAGSTNSNPATITSAGYLTARDALERPQTFTKPKI